MAQAFGPDSTLSIAGADISASVKTIDFTLSRAAMDVTVKGMDGVAKKGGLTDGELSFTGLWDDTAITGSHTVLATLADDAAPTTPTAFVYKPNGVKTYTGTAVMTSYAESSPIDDMVAFTASFSISGAVVQS